MRKLSVPRLPKIKAPRLNLRGKYYKVSTALYFLFNQVMPSPRVKSALPEHFSPLEGVRSGGRSAPSAVPRTLPSNFKLTTWNIEMGYQQEKVMADMPTVKADVLLLQEVPVFTPQSAPLLADYGAYYAYAPGLFIKQHCRRYAFTSRGQLTLSNVVPLKTHMIHLPKVVTLHPDTSKDRFGRRIALYTKLKTEKGTLGVYNVHLENYSTPPGRRMQLAEIFDHMAQERDTHVIMAGDMNTVYGKLELVGITKKTGLVRAKTGRTCGVFSLDHILHSRNIELIAKVVRKNSSDHHPIVADVKLL